MRFKLFAILALAALTVLALACGDDDDDDDAGDNGATATTAATAGTGAPSATGDTPDDGGEASELIINVENFAFDPAAFTIPAGQDVPITLTNADSAPHTFTVYTDADFTEAEGTNIGVRATANAEGTVNFEVGEYFFLCDFHPDSMQGTFTAE